MRKFISFTFTYVLLVFSAIGQQKYAVEYSYGSDFLGQDQKRMLFVEGSSLRYEHHQEYEQATTPQGYLRTSQHDFYTILQSDSTINFLRTLENGISFRSTYNANSLPWVLTEETQEIMGYMCQKAVLKSDYAPSFFHSEDSILGDIFAWFTMDFAAPGGPEGLNGLPGLILLVNYSEGTNFRLVAKKIETLEASIDFEIKGIEVNPEQVWNPDLIDSNQMKLYKKMSKEK